ncbi:unnamed protein product [Sympodiomycopsis kandeliae]
MTDPHTPPGRQSAVFGDPDSTPKSDRSGKDASTLLNTIDTNTPQSPDLRSLALTDRERFPKSYQHDETTGYGLYTWLGSEFATDTSTIEQGTYVENLDVLHPPSGDIWVTALQGKTSAEVYTSAMGRVAHTLQNQYANIRMVLHFLLFGLSVVGDVRLTAVKVHPKVMDRWAQMGTVWSYEDNIIEVDLESADQNILQTHMTSGHVLASWWSPTGDLRNIRTPHPKDLQPQVRKTQLRTFGNFLESARRSAVMLAFGDLCAKVKSATRGLWSETIDHEVAHIVHACRGNKFFRNGVVAREVMGGELTTIRDLQESLSGPENAIILQKHLHHLFDQKKMVIIPFPNAGYHAPSKPRHPQETFQGIPLVVHRGEVHLPLASETLALHIVQPSSKAPSLASISIPTTPSEEFEDMAGQWIANGPRAGLLAYSAVVRLLGREKVLHQELLEWISRFNQPLCPDEMLVGVDWDTISIATASTGGE